MTATIQECLELQLLEMEMLFSMFPRKEEISLEDVNSLLYVRQYLEGTCKSLPPTIAFTFFVKTEDPRVQAELHVSLPHTYPQKEPQLFVRLSAADRQQQNLVNKSLAAYISSVDQGELCLTNAVQWLQDNVTSYIQYTHQQVEPGSDTKQATDTFYRMWIYSHHIYRQEPRKKILDCARRLNLTGFSLTGKPGVICVEGLKEQCEEFWRDIRYPNWKHISCKHTESKTVTGKIDDMRLFHSFEELKFAAHRDYGIRNDFHMDLGQFVEYLKQHHSEHIFHILFGI